MLVASLVGEVATGKGAVPLAGQLGVGAVEAKGDTAGDTGGSPTTLPVTTSMSRASARVFTTAGSEAKCAACRDLGAEVLVSAAAKAVVGKENESVLCRHYR